MIVNIFDWDHSAALRSTRRVKLSSYNNEVYHIRTHVFISQHWKNSRSGLVEKWLIFCKIAGLRTAFAVICKTHRQMFATKVLPVCIYLLIWEYTSMCSHFSVTPWSLSPAEKRNSVYSVFFLVARQDVIMMWTLRLPQSKRLLKADQNGQNGMFLTVGTWVLLPGRGKDLLSNGEKTKQLSGTDSPR